jgi:hypothetical protein
MYEDQLPLASATGGIVKVDMSQHFNTFPIPSDDSDFIDRLLTTNVEFRRLMEERRREAVQGKASSIEQVRARLEEKRP